MVKKYKIQKPKFIDELEEIDKIEAEIAISEKLQNKIIENAEVDYLNEKGLTIDSCIFKNSIFNNCSLQNIDLLDSIFENCDLSNVDFAGGSIHRVEFINCKLLGTKFEDCNIKEVSFNRSIGKYINLSFSKVKNVIIEECNFSEGIFQQVKLDKVSFNETDLTNSYFNKTALNKIDFTTCDITGIDVEIEDLSGAIVDTMQALDLTRLMNIVVK